MARVFFISLVLLVLPFLVYDGYTRFVRGMKKENAWHDAPVVELGLAGVALAVAGLVGMVYMTGM